MPGETSLVLDLSEFRKNLKALRDRDVEAAPKMVRDVGHALISSAQGRVPIETGFLKASGILAETGKPLGVEIGFNATYAAAVHERLEPKHPQGEAKYLEKAIKIDGPEIFLKAAKHYAARMGMN